MKTKLHRTCEVHCSIHVLYKCKKVIERLSRNNDIITMKQDKESGVVIKQTKVTQEMFRTFEH